jgi:hypothetical protein
MMSLDIDPAGNGPGSACYDEKDRSPARSRLDVVQHSQNQYFARIELDTYRATATVWPVAHAVPFRQ